MEWQKVKVEDYIKSMEGYGHVYPEYTHIVLHKKSQRTYFH